MTDRNAYKRAWVAAHREQFLETQRRYRRKHGKPATFIGRGSPVGEDHPGHILTEPEVLEIKAVLEVGGQRGFQRQLAYRYGVSPATICDIKYQRSWTHL